MQTTLAHSPPREEATGLPGPLRRVLALGGPWRGYLEIRLPGGHVARLGEAACGHRAVMTIHDLGQAHEILGRGPLGFADSYAAGHWDTPDLPGLLTLLATNLDALRDFTTASPIGRAWEFARRLVCRNGRARSRRNAAVHYDLGNAFYAAWLDPTMTYSAAVFAADDQDLECAQIRKFRQLAKAARILPTHHVLEIGCGWGGFAAFLAREIGCRVTAATVSREQYEGARARIAAAGLTEQVEVILADYRDIRGRFDRVLAVEMFEAVGEAYWPLFFRRLDELLLPGGRAGLQLITIADQHFARYRSETDFIRQAIFPGGMLPSDGALTTLEKRFALRRVSETAFAADYARTLSHWRVRFHGAAAEIAAQGFDERFRRRWDYYLAYCEAGFRTGHIDVRQVVYERRDEAMRA